MGIDKNRALQDGIGPNPKGLGAILIIFPATLFNIFEVKNEKKYVVYSLDETISTSLLRY